MKENSTHKNILYCISDLNKALAFEWISDRINHKKITLFFILINSSPDAPIIQYLKNKNITYYNLKYKTIFSYLPLVWKIFCIIKKHHIDGIHCHLLKANVAGLTAALIAGLTMRIYTRHHSDYNYIYSPKGILLDKWCNKIATQIVAISLPVEEILIKREHVPAQKVKIIPHGFDLAYFRNYDATIVRQLNQKYNPKDQSPVIGVIARFTEYKGIQFIIPAFKKLLSDYPNARLMLFNAQGDYESRIKELLLMIPTENYVLIPFENNLSEVYRLFDCYVHVPDSYYSEAFGQTYIEALLCGVPSIFTLSGIASSFIQDGVNALTVAYKNSEQIYKKMNSLLKDPILYHNIKDTLDKSDYASFSLEKFIFELENLYLE